MSFEEFIKFIEERHCKKHEELIKERDEIKKEYDEILEKIKKLRPPFFKKKKPILFAIGGVVVAIAILLFHVKLIEAFPKIPKVLFNMLSTILSVTFGCGGISYYKYSKHEQGQDTERYLEYQYEVNELREMLNKLKLKLRQCGSELSNLEFYMVTEEKVQLAKECYLYLIPKELKCKKINIDDRLIDSLLRNSSIAAIIYKYYRGELEDFGKLTLYERYKETQALAIEDRIKFAKLKAHEETTCLETHQQSYEAIESKGQVQPSEMPYQRRRRADKYRHDCVESLPTIDEEDTKGRRK